MDIKQLYNDNLRKLPNEYGDVSVMGETGNFLRKGETAYNQQIRDPRIRMLKVSEHTDNCANTLNPKYFIFPFNKMYTDSPTLRRAKEKFFINKLRPKLNRAV